MPLQAAYGAGFIDIFIVTGYGPGIVLELLACSVAGSGPQASSNHYSSVTPDFLQGTKLDHFINTNLF